MKIKSLYFYWGIISLLSMLCGISCVSSSRETDNKQKYECLEIDLASAIDAPIEPLNLSDFVEDVEYIRPEYPASLVDIVFLTSLDDKHLLLETRGKLLLYGRDGKFIREIGKQGQGPNEYLGIRSSALLNDQIAINANYNRNIFWYDTVGNYLSQTPVSDNVFRISIMDTNRVAIHLHHGVSMDDPDLFVAGIIDRDGKIVQLQKTIPYYPKGISTSPAIWNYNDTIRVFTCLNDTVYSISRDEITPKYVVHFGKYKVSREAFANIELWQKERGLYIYGPSFCETSKYLLIKFQYNSKAWFARYDKSTQQVSAWSIKPNSVNKYGFIEGGGWTNDVDGGIAPTHFQSHSNGYFTSDVQPDQLIEDFAENKKEIKVNDLGKQQRLEKIISSLSEDENPIIMLYKLKQ